MFKLLFAFFIKGAAIILGILLAICIISMIFGSLELRFGAGSRKINSDEEEEDEENWDDEEDEED